MKKLIALFVFFVSFKSFAQVGINSTNSNPHSSAMLDVSSTSKGALLPRMTADERRAIQSPANGLIVYQTNETPGFYYFDGAQWSTFSSDNLGSHMMTKNVATNGNVISKNGDNLGLRISDSGRLSVLGKTSCCTPNGTMETFKLDPDGGFMFGGQLGVGFNPKEGKGYRTSWHPYKGAFRSGYADNEWDDSATGFFSWAGGSNSTARGLYSLAFGDGNLAHSTSSIVFGSGNKVWGAAGFAAGNFNVVNDTYGAALGYSARSKAKASMSFGYSLTTKGYASTTVGIYNDSLMIDDQQGVSYNTPLFTVGNGSTNAQRSNAFIVQKDGKVYIDPSNKNTGTVASNLLVFGGYNNTGEGIGSKRTLGGNQYGLDFYTASQNRLSITNSGNVGIQTSTPAAKLDISGGNWDVTNGEGDLRIGNGSYRLKMGVAVGGGGAGAATIMQHGQEGGFNVLSLGAQGGNIMYLNGNRGNVGIHTSDPLFPLTFGNIPGNKIALWSSSPTAFYGFGIQNRQFQVFVDDNMSDISFGYGSSTAFTENMKIRGNGSAWLRGSLQQNSDSRLKRNIQNITNALPMLMQVSGYHYYWKDKKLDSALQTGIMAQEIQKVFPELVKQDEKGDLSVNYSGLIPYVIEATKEQQKTIEELKADVKHRNEKIMGLEIENYNQRQDIELLKKQMEELMKAVKK